VTLEERIDRIFNTSEIVLVGEAYQKSLAHIPEIIENMQFLEEMKPDKENASFDKYSYYVSAVNIDDKPYIILSTVGHKNQGVYYDQNVFEGTPKEVFAKAGNAGDNSKYGRLAETLPGLFPRRLRLSSTNKYTKNFGDVQGKI